MIEQMSDYLTKRTTVTSRTETFKVLEPPTITICMEPVFKTSIAKQFEIFHSTDVHNIDIPNFAFSETFSKLSYILNRDYELYFEPDRGTTIIK